MTTQIPPTEERVSRLEGAFEQVNERVADLRADMNAQVGGLRTDLNGLRADMNAQIEGLRAEMAAQGKELRAEMAELRSDMNTRINLTLVALGGSWATMVAGFIAIARML